MANLSTATPTPDSISTWYPETVARIFNVPVDGEFVRHYMSRVDEHEFGMIVDRLDLRGDPAKRGDVTVRILYWMYEQRLRQDVLERALSGDYRITGCDEKFLTLEHLAGDLATMPYADYLNTVHWQAVKIAALERAGRRCYLCNSNELLEVHHRTYERRGREQDGDVVVLCRDCHERFHAPLDGVVTRMPVQP